MKRFRYVACLIAAVVTVDFGAVSAHAEQSVTVQEEEIVMVAPEPVQETVTEEPAQEVAPVEEPVQETPVEEPVQEVTPSVEPVQETTPVVEPTQETTPVVEQTQEVVTTPATEQPVVETTTQPTVVETVQPVVTETVTAETVETVQITEVADTTPAVTVTQAVVETKTEEAPTVDVKGARREIEKSTDDSSIVEEGEEIEVVEETPEFAVASLSPLFAILLALLLLLVALLYRYKVVVVSDNDDEDESRIYISFRKACEKAIEAEKNDSTVSVTIEAAGIFKLYRKLRNESVDRVETIYRHDLTENFYESVYATDSEIEIMEETLGFYLDRDSSNSWILPEELEKMAADEADEMARIGAENLIEMALDQI